MKAAVLEDVAQMTVRGVPDPEVGPRDVLIRVGAVGVCGTDLHLFQGHGNYNFDPQGRPIPLTVQPQILGHEFSGEILEEGREVKDLKPGDRVLCDQGLNCVSQGRSPLCPIGTRALPTAARGARIRESWPSSHRVRFDRPRRSGRPSAA